jgi:hypothetical protein
VNQVVGFLAGLAVMGIGVYLIVARKRVAKFYAERAERGWNPATSEMFKPALVGFTGAVATGFGFTFLIVALMIEQ